MTIDLRLKRQGLCEGGRTAEKGTGKSGVNVKWRRAPLKGQEDHRLGKGAAGRKMGSGPGVPLDDHTAGQQRWESLSWSVGAFLATGTVCSKSFLVKGLQSPGLLATGHLGTRGSDWKQDTGKDQNQNETQDWFHGEPFLL